MIKKDAARRQRAAPTTSCSSATGTPGRTATARSIFVLPIANGSGDRQRRADRAATLIGDTPSKPYGGGEEIAWSADGRTVYFALREAGRIEPISTNLDIFSRARRRIAAPTNLTADNDGDRQPARPPSPDGKWLAYVAMARPTYEADRQVLSCATSRPAQTRALTDKLGPFGRLDRLGAGRQVAFSSPPRIRWTAPVFRVDVGERQGRRGSTETARSTGESSRSPTAACSFAMNSLLAPDDLYCADAKGKASAAHRRSMPTSSPSSIWSTRRRRFSFTGANGDTVWGYDRQAGRPPPAQAADRLHRPWRPAGQLRQRLVLPLEPAAVRRRRAMAWSASISTDRPATARPSPTRSTTIGAAGRSRTCRSGLAAAAAQDRPARRRQCLRARRSATAAI